MPGATRGSRSTRTRVPTTTKGRYATIDITYDDASRTLTFGKRSGQFDGMLRQRRFNVVYVTKDQPRPLNMENPEGAMVSYNGKAISVRL